MATTKATGTRRVRSTETKLERLQRELAEAQAVQSSKAEAKIEKLLVQSEKIEARMAQDAAKLDEIVSQLRDLGYGQGNDAQSFVDAIHDGEDTDDEQ